MNPHPNQTHLGRMNIHNLLEAPKMHTTKRKMISKINDDYRSMLIIESTKQLKDEYRLDKEKLLGRKFKPLLSENLNKTLINGLYNNSRGISAPKK